VCAQLSIKKALNSAPSCDTSCAAPVPVAGEYIHTFDLFLVDYIVKKSNNATAADDV